MGKALADTHAAARRIFEEADDALGFPISRLSFEGPEDALKLTENTQPALLTVSIAAFEVLKERGFTPDYVAGHSLGEYSALVAAGSLRFADAVRLVRKRGRYMQEAVPPGVRAMELAKAAGARRAVLLPVSAPFHCALMKPAQQRLRADLDATDFRDLSRPLVNNWQAREIRAGAEAREGLYQQVPNPVRWLESIRHLAGLGIGRFVEVGAGGVLTGLVRGIDASLAGVKFGEPPDLDALGASGWISPN